MNQRLFNRSGASIGHPLPGIATAIAALVIAQAQPAIADTVKITCAQADMIAGADDPLTVTYEGDASGTLTVASERINLALPATKELRTGEFEGKPHSVTGIRAFAEVETTMPDRAALEACAAKSVAPEFKDDADMFAVSMLSCVKSAQSAAAPVRVAAQLSVALVPSDIAGAADDVVVEIKRTYLEKANAPGGSISLDAFPGQCVLEGE